MSSRQYTVTVKLKDDGLLKKLDSVGGGSVGGGGGNKNSVSGMLGGGGIFKKLEGLGAGQLLKLAGIAGGVASLVALTIKSSAQLQGIGKMWEAGFMLIFKPFGDFVAQLFRPMTIMFLQFAVPFYKVATTYFKNWLEKANEVSDAQVKTAKEGLGSLNVAELNATGGLMLVFSQLKESISKTFSTQAKDLEDALKGIPAAAAKVWTDFNTLLGEKLTSIPKDVAGVFTKLGEDTKSALVAIPGFISSVFLTLGNDVWNTLTKIPGFLSSIFLTVGNDIWNTLLDVPGTLYDVFTGLAGDIASKLAGIPGAIWDAIMSAVNRISGGVLGGSGTADTSSRFTQGNTRARTNVAGIADTLG